MSGSPLPSLPHNKMLLTPPLRRYSPVRHLHSLHHLQNLSKRPGDLSIFDPNEVALLQGTMNINDRICDKVQYTSAPPQNIADTPPAGVDISNAEHFLEHLDSNDELPLNIVAKPQSPVVYY